MSSTRRPSSLDGIKRLAKAIKSEQGITHHEALELGAQRAGYQSFTHARHILAGAPPSPPAGIRELPLRPRQGPGGSRREFLAQCRNAWVQALDYLNPDQKVQLSWHGAAAIKAALDPVLATTRSHAHLPTGGGHDFSGLRVSHEPGCLEFNIAGGANYIVRPKSMILQRMAAAPAESFLLLELDELPPTGIYEEHVFPGSERAYRQEQLVELSPAEYVDRTAWDEGSLGYDERGYTIPLPDSARLVVRWRNGKILFVTKGSIWNGMPETYDGRHDRMCASDIRTMIEQRLPDALDSE